MTTMNVGKWNVRVVTKSESYGSGNCLAHTGDDPAVEFYDGSQDTERFGELGQFVTRYQLSTLLEHQDGKGLILDGGIPVWRVAPNDMDEVKTWLRALSE